MNNYFFKKNYVSITAGQFKGKKIFFSNTSNVRPTMSRIRETLFNWLSKNIKNAHCLDCFAGSGVLGIESISHYAKSVTSLEIEKKTVLTLLKNIQKLKINNINIIHTNSIYWLKKNGTPYDIIFIDPPYKMNLLNKTIILLNKNNWIKKNSIIYIEKDKKTPLVIPKNWILHKQKKTSKIEFFLYIFNV
ncbi:16S rRNA (guanine(966)-N(2))-methyltransferase RsmD [Buchnera aphidicola]|uniref:16S rRNA (guanine(966)-N(2))-methyltransferase RsmD n=1 Tax=Buchnera aphidicola TaxID=9 RepID=UPI003BEEEC09